MARITWAVPLQGVGPEAEGLWEALLRIAQGPTLRAVAIVLIGFPLVFVLSKWIRRLVGRRYDPQWGLVAGKLTFYPLVILLAISVLRELGFSLTPLLGAAGILGVALGFASQTSVSHVISGFFLLGEQPFQVNDVIQIGDTTGRVLSVDMLSVKLRTFDNRFVRIPNETIIKSQVTTNTRFPIRRVDVSVGVAYKEDTGRVRDVLLDVADRNPLSMMEPEPQVFYDGFGDSGINLRLAVWATTENFLLVKNRLQEEIKQRFDEEGIEIPFPHVSLYAGSASGPLPVALVGSPGPGAPPDRRRPVAPEGEERPGSGKGSLLTEPGASERDA